MKKKKKKVKLLNCTSQLAYKVYTQTEVYIQLNI